MAVALVAGEANGAGWGAGAEGADVVVIVGPMATDEAPAVDGSAGTGTETLPLEEGAITTAEGAPGVMLVPGVPWLGAGGESVCAATIPLPKSNGKIATMNSTLFIASPCRLNRTSHLPNETIRRSNAFPRPGQAYAKVRLVGPKARAAPCRLSITRLRRRT